MTKDLFKHALIPMQFIGPIKIRSEDLSGEFKLPMATFETPLWPSCNRGAKVSRLAGGINAVICKDNMTRSIVLQAPSANSAYDIVTQIYARSIEISTIVKQSSRFAIFQEIQHQIIGKLIYLRIAINSNEASGHNMATIVAENILNWLLKEYPELKYQSISGNYCTDKKVSAVNGILGRGKYLIAEIQIPFKIVAEVLKTTPEKIVNLHIKKNLLGSILAGSVRTANAHFANMLLASYLATGQDAANIVEGSQGIVHCELINEDLYFSVTLPNMIVGSIGNGKNLPFVLENINQIGCPNLNARKLSIIIASAVLCGELSLLAAQTNSGELVNTHLSLERN